MVISAVMGRSGCINVEVLFLITNLFCTCFSRRYRSQNHRVEGDL